MVLAVLVVSRIMCNWNDESGDGDVVDGSGNMIIIIIIIIS